MVRVFDIAAFAALLALGVVLPFEFAGPWLHVGVLEITNVEVLVYAVLALWGAEVVLCRRIGWTPVHAAVATWLAVLVLSAWLADSGRDTALTFALRGAGGCLLFLAVADLASTGRRPVYLVRALVAGAAVSAAAGLAEIWSPGVASLLATFKTQPSFVGGFLRASGTFQYANIAAMYWEAAIGLTFAASVSRATAGTRRASWIFVAATLLFTEAIVLSASRAAWWGALAVLGMLAVSTWRRQRHLMAPLAVAIVGFAALTAVDVGGSGLLSRRLQRDEPSTWYRARYQTVPSTIIIRAGEEGNVRVVVENAGTLHWAREAPNQVFLSYHWYDEFGRTLIAFEGVRTPLPHDVSPGRDVAVEAKVYAVFPPGQYRIEWDFFQEGVTWFGVLGGPTGQTTVIVEPGVPVAALPKLPLPPSLASPARPPRRVLWHAVFGLWREHPLFGIGPDRFRHVYGEQLGLRRFDNRMHASSLYIETLVGQGLMGLAALVVLMAALAAAARRACVVVSPERHLLTVGVVVSLAAFFVHGVVDHFLPFTSTYGLFWVLAGLVVALARR